MDFLGHKHVFMYKACGKLGGSRGMLPQGNFDFGLFLDAIWWNLGLFLHKIYCVSLKPVICI